MWFGPAGSWRPLFKPSQILKTEFPEHESFHNDVDSQYQNMVGDDHDNQLRSSPSLSDHLTVVGSDGDVGSVGGGYLKKHNHMIHLHLIPHIYVPVVHSAGFPEAKHFHHHGAAAEDGDPPSSLPAVHHQSDGHTVDHLSSAEFPAVDGGGTGPGGTGSGESATSAGSDHDHGNYNGHSGETSYFTITEDAVVNQQNPALPDLNVDDHFGNAVDSGGGGGGGVNHDYEAPVHTAHDEPHQYQVCKVGIF